MSEQKLNLFKLASGFVAQPRTSASKIMGSHFLKVCLCAELSDD
jgi:hypothetical protein